uniref:Tetratricopeptide repeat protein 5 OB fold domain-containing protein n=1 Tax=Accipiter nisus TaxID=211598 RepID=A0A8B9NEC7_9AVES
PPPPPPPPPPQERVDPEAANNPDLHLNRATLLQYQERFGAALEGLGRAAALAPGWEEPRRRHAHLLDFLGRLCALLANRGKLRGKRRRGLEGPLPPSLLGPLGRGLRPSPLAALQPGPNPQRVLLGRVLFTLTPPEGVPYAVGVADGAGSAAALTIYNAAPGWGVLVGDGLAVPEPRLCLHQHQWQGKGSGCRRRCRWSSTGVARPAPPWPPPASPWSTTPPPPAKPRPLSHAPAAPPARRGPGRGRGNKGRRPLCPGLLIWRVWPRPRVETTPPPRARPRPPGK